MKDFFSMLVICLMSGSFMIVPMVILEIIVITLVTKMEKRGFFIKLLFLKITALSLYSTILSFWIYFKKDNITYIPTLILFFIILWLVTFAVEVCFEVKKTDRLKLQILNRFLYSSSFVVVFLVIYKLSEN